MSKLLDLQNGPSHDGDRYFAKKNSVYLVFTGDVIFRFDIATTTIGAKAAAAYAKAICEDLNRLNTLTGGGDELRIL